MTPYTYVMIFKQIVKPEFDSLLSFSSSNSLFLPSTLVNASVNLNSAGVIVQPVRMVTGVIQLIRIVKIANVIHLELIQMLRISVIHLPVNVRVLKVSVNFNVTSVLVVIMGTYLSVNHAVNVSPAGITSFKN